MDSIVSAWGNSLGVRIPKTYAEEIGLKKGGKVRVFVEKGRLIIRPVKGYSLKNLVDQISSENSYEEMDFGRPVGKEAW
jgi:antitoxin MazE